MDYVASRRQQIEQTGFALVRIDGKSMRPLIWGGGHCVALVPVEGEPNIGDLLAFKYNIGGEDRGVVHRLVEIRESNGGTVYITRGDNCLGCEQVRRSDIIGKVAEVHRLSGFRPWYILPAKRFAVTDPAYLRYLRLWSVTWPARRLYYLLRAHANGLRVRLLSIFGKR